MLKQRDNTFLSFLCIAVAAVMCSCNPKDSTESTNSEDTTKVDTTAEAAQEKPVIASPRKQAEGKIGDVTVTVDYGSPGVKGRKIWGGLEDYGKVWRAGANETTSFEFSGNVEIGGKQVKAGKYGFYLIPNENADWVAIINTDWSREKHGAWGAYNYNPEHDVVRVNIQPQWSDDIQERLEYKVTDDSIDLLWEKVTISIPVVPVAKGS